MDTTVRAIVASCFHGIVPPLLVFAELGERLLVFKYQERGGKVHDTSIVMIKFYKGRK